MAAGGDFKIGDGYVEVHLRDATDADARKLKKKLSGISDNARVGLKDDTASGVAKLRKRLSGLDASAKVKLDAKEVGPQLSRLKQQLDELKRSAKVTPKFEARQFTDEYGRVYTRYVKASRDAGTFASEAIGASMYKGVATMIRQPGLFAPVLGAAAALGSSAAILGIPAIFAKIGFDIQSSNKEVAESFKTLEKDVTAALKVDSAPMADGLIRNTERIGKSFQTLRPQLRDIFTEIPGQLDLLTSGVTRFATNAMPGLVTAVRSANPVVAGLADAMASAGTGVTRFYTEAATGAPAAGSSLRSIGVIVSDLLGLLGRLSASLGSALAPVLSNAEGAFSRLTTVVGNFATNALPGIGTGLEVATSMFSAALAVISPFSSAIGTIAGVVLGSTIAVRGLSAALGILATAKVLASLSPLKSAFTTLATQVATSGVAMAGFTTRATGSAKAGEAVAAASNKAVTGLRGIGAAAPALAGTAAAIGAVTIAIDNMNVKAANGAQNLSGMATNLHDFRTTAGAIFSGDIGFGRIVDQAKAAAMGIKNAFAGFKLTPIELNVDTAAAKAQADRLINEINGATPQVNINGNTTGAAFAYRQILAEIAAGKAEIIIDGQPVPAEQALAKVKSMIDTATGNVTINGDGTTASNALQKVLGEVNSAAPSITIDGNIDPVTGKITQAVSTADGSTGTITIDGNPSPADGKIHGSVQLANGSTGTITIDGNQQPANGKINATVTYADGSTGTIKVDAATGAAEAAINHAARDRTATVYLRTVGAPANANDSVGRVRASHGGSGGFVAGFAGGGFAGGGFRGGSRSGGIIPGYAPGVDDVPAVLSKGESVLVPELTRALGAGRILAANREASGGRPATVVGSMAGMMDGTIGQRFSGGGLVKPGAGGFAGGGSVGSSIKNSAIAGGPHSYMMLEWADATLKAAKLDPGSDKGKIAAAEKQIIDALRSEKEAWLALTQARKDAARALEDLREKTSDYALDAEDADIAVARATERMQAVLKDRGATALDKREAINAHKQAVERQKDLREENERDRKALRDLEDRGVEGSEGVLDAKDAVVVAKGGTAAAKVGLVTTKADIKKAKEDKKKADAEKKKQEAAAKKSKSFDSGGVARGIGLLPKLTRKPERVLDPGTTVAFERLVSVLEQRGGRPTTPTRSMGDVHVHMTQPPGSMNEAARMTALALRSIG